MTKSNEREGHIQESINLKGVLTVILAGALVGYLAYEKLGLKEYLDKIEQQSVETCDPVETNCDEPIYLFPRGAW